MDEKKWERFFDLLTEIVNSEKPWEEKATDLNHQARHYGAETELVELAAWVDSW